MFWKLEVGESGEFPAHRSGNFQRCPCINTYWILYLCLFVIWQGIITIPPYLIMGNFKYSFDDTAAQLKPITKQIVSSYYFLFIHNDNAIIERNNSPLLTSIFIHFVWNSEKSNYPFHRIYTQTIIPILICCYHNI